MIAPALQAGAFPPVVQMKMIAADGSITIISDMPLA